MFITSSFFCCLLLLISFLLFFFISAFLIIFPYFCSDVCVPHYLFTFFWCLPFYFLLMSAFLTIFSGFFLLSAFTTRHILSKVSTLSQFYGCFSEEYFKQSSGWVNAMCLFKISFLVKHLWQNWHWKGLAPLCVFSCRFKLILEHITL